MAQTVEIPREHLDAAIVYLAEAVHPTRSHQQVAQTLNVLILAARAADTPAEKEDENA